MLSALDVGDIDLQFLRSLLDIVQSVCECSDLRGGCGNLVGDLATQGADLCRGGRIHVHRLNDSNENAGIYKFRDNLNVESAVFGLTSVDELTTGFE